MELCAENEYVTLFRSWWNHNGNSLRISANCKQSWIILLRVQNVAEAFRCWNMKCWSILVEVADFVGMWSHLFSALSNVLLCLFWCIIQSLCHLLFTFDFRVFWTVLYFSLCASQGHSNWLQDAKGGWVHWFLGFLILWPLLFFFYWQTGLTHMIFLLCNDNWASQGSSFYLWMLIRVYGSLVFEFPYCDPYYVSFMYWQVGFSRKFMLISGCQEGCTVHWFSSSSSTSAKTVWIWFCAGYHG